MNPVYSMTGFGRHGAERGSKKITVEIKSVNHRYLDLSMKMSRHFNPFEADIRAYLKKRVNRGKIDLFINYEDQNQTAETISYNRETASRYMEIYRQIADDFGLDRSISLSMIAKSPDVITAKNVEDDEAELKLLLMEALEGATDNFISQRANEGENLRSDLLEKLSLITEYVKEIIERSPSVVRDYREALTERISNVLEDKNIDESRILTEAAIFADKTCIDEEMVRMKSHIQSMEDALKGGGPIGRNLDFIAQEMNREVNTALSKTLNIEITACEVKLKTEVEKVREQIQNIE